MPEETNQPDKETIIRNPPKKPYFSVWSPLVDKRIVIQQKGGIVITGLFLGLRDSFFVLEDATVGGKKFKAQPTKVLVDRAAVAHMHEECPVEIVE